VPEDERTNSPPAPTTAAAQAAAPAAAPVPLLPPPAYLPSGTSSMSIEGFSNFSPGWGCGGGLGPPLRRRSTGVSRPAQRLQEVSQQSSLAVMVATTVLVPVVAECEWGGW
jgi:hypothetical protein